MPEGDGTLSVVLVGVESTGKSTLARRLAETLGAPLVSEVARGWLAARGNRYEEGDLETIARLQWQAEETARATASLVVVDTDLAVLRVWSEARFGRCAPWILDRLAERPAARYLLPRPDLPWEPDPQRESPDAGERVALHERYRKLLEVLGHPWREIAGQGEKRVAAALAAVRALRQDA